MFCINPNSLKEWKHVADAVLRLLLSSSSLQLQFVCLWMVIAEWKDCRSSFWCKDEFIQHIVVGIWTSVENIISPNWLWAWSRSQLDYSEFSTFFIHMHQDHNLTASSVSKCKLFGSKIRHWNEGEMIVSHQNLRPSWMNDEALRDWCMWGFWRTRRAGAKIVDINAMLEAKKFRPQPNPNWPNQLPILDQKFEPQPSSNQANRLPILDQPSFDGWTFRVVMSLRAHQCEYNNHCTKDP